MQTKMPESFPILTTISSSKNTSTSSYFTEEPFVKCCLKMVGSELKTQRINHCTHPRSIDKSVVNPIAHPTTELHTSATHISDKCEDNVIEN